MCAHRGKRGFVGPLGFGHEVMQRLVSRGDAIGLHACSHRLDTLALAGQQQTRAIRPARSDAISVFKRGRNCLDIVGKPYFAVLTFGFETHNPPPRVSISTLTNPAASSKSFMTQ